MCKYTFINGKYVNPANCPDGDSCSYCHTKNELYYHPKNFRMKLCQRHPCPYGEYCPDKHLEEFEEEKDAEEYETLKKEYQKLKHKLEKKEKLSKSTVKYWKCNSCQIILASKFYFLKVCLHKLCEKCASQAVKIGKCPECMKDIENQPLMVDLLGAQNADKKTIAEESDDEDIQFFVQNQISELLIFIDKQNIYHHSQYSVHLPQQYCQYNLSLFIL
eukprot:TRINITY_DN1075_c0_g1_i2.p4 TRINITY_DN1075_c0_g1~~TRINITY_DN1075_c0_g1_i2.p4  ORF type:complete len:218 (-),score=19.68 TRINITY_DN1075_c0_g1_i2:2862-3515(-)